MILSYGAQLIAAVGREKLFQPDWKKLFDQQSMKEQVNAIVRGVQRRDFERK